MIKIHILFKFNEGIWGGGNQFLKALRSYLASRGAYENNIEKADVLLFNSYPFDSEYFFEQARRIKNQNPNVCLIHRVDGPIFYVRGRDLMVDKIIFKFNQLIADGTIYQSEWSRQRSIELGMCQNLYTATIINTPDPAIFYKKPDYQFTKNNKIKLVVTSWSANFRKGFDIYAFLDKNLDFTRYEMTFIGNSLIPFTTIRYIHPLPSKQLADALRQHDIFIAASLNEPCSNSLIEALHCGLPAVVRNSGSYPEIIGNMGVIFNDSGDVCEAIDKLASNYSEYVNRLFPPGMEEVGERYYRFMYQIHHDVLNGGYQPKRMKMLDYFNLMIFSKAWKISSKARAGYAKINMVKW